MVFYSFLSFFSIFLPVPFPLLGSYCFENLFFFGSPTKRKRAKKKKKGKRKKLGQWHPIQLFLLHKLCFPLGRRPCPSYGSPGFSVQSERILTLHWLARRPRILKLLYILVGLALRSGITQASASVIFCIRRTLISPRTTLFAPVSVCLFLSSLLALAHDAKGSTHSMYFVLCTKDVVAYPIHRSGEPGLSAPCEIRCLSESYAPKSSKIFNSIGNAWFGLG